MPSVASDIVSLCGSCISYCNSLREQVQDHILLHHCFFKAIQPEPEALVDRGDSYVILGKA